MADGMTLQVTAKTITKARLIEMVESLGLGIPVSEIHSVIIGRTEIVVETPMRRSADGFLEARVRTIPVHG